MLQHIICFVLVLYLCLAQEDPLVKTSLGKIRGHHKRSYGGRTFAAFEGIPYAKPPIGDLRFEAPQSVKPWSGIWDAKSEHECIQRNFINADSVGSEDCLYLNVYVPKEQPVPNENLDVVVYIHGGAFMLGSAAMCGPEYLMDRDIVYISLNYRLGVMGFLSTEDEVVSGNMGMKDQVLALQWIKKHVHQFGGNPNSVTIIGISAGGAAVHLHYFSALAKGLFHRGISQSGTALAPWAIQDAPLETAKKIAASIGCNSNCPKELIKCLKERPANQVVENSYNLSPYSQLPIAPFAPVIEKKSKGAFLTEHPYKLLTRGEVAKVPWITSVTTDEGMLCFYMLREKLHLLNEEWDKILPYFLEYNNTVGDSDKPKIQQLIRKKYFGDEHIITNDIENLVRLLGDRFFVVNLEESARMQAKVSDSSIYSYIYGYHGDSVVDFSKVFGTPPPFKGVGHGEDGNLLYKLKFPGITFNTDKLSEPDEQIKDLLVDMVVSFAKNGKPKVNDIEWDEVQDTGDYPYLFIHNDGIKMDSKQQLAPIQFWNSLPIKENQNIAGIKDEL